MLNLSQAQLADGLGVSFQQVQKYETAQTASARAACSKQQST
jgi:transcriptional regulator with XRE-family HTH domain